MSPPPTDTCGNRFEPNSKWETPVSEAVRILADVAREGRTITYGELSARIASKRLPARSQMLMRVLGDACDELDSRRDVMHASLVVRADSGMPGDGYFVWIERSGLHVDDREAFWRCEVAKVWASYAQVK